MHMKDYVDAATTNVLSPNILPVADLRYMLKHIEFELPSMMHLPISSSDITLHFHWYLNTHVLITDKTVPAPHQCAHTKTTTTA